jgi:MFS transporter, SP family, sugar:H+ symporter
MFACFMVFASIGHFSLDQQTPMNTPGAGTAMIVFACLFIAAFAMTWGPIIWAVIGEIYPTRYRAICMGLATASNWIWNFLISFFTPFITGDIDYAYGYVFAGCCLAGAIVVYFFLPESQGRSLEEIDTMYILHVKPWKSKKWQVPEDLLSTDASALSSSARDARKERNPTTDARHEDTNGLDRTQH